MTEYFDIRCGDDLDEFGRDAAPLEVFAQDIYHMLITDAQSLIGAEDWAQGLESRLGRPLPSTLATDVENAIRRDDRASDAKCKITRIAGEEEAYDVNIQVEATSGFIELALQLTKDGLVRVS